MRRPGQPSKGGRRRCGGRQPAGKLRKWERKEKRQQLGLLELGVFDSPLFPDQIISLLDSSPRQQDRHKNNSSRWAFLRESDAAQAILRERNTFKMKHEFDWTEADFDCYWNPGHFGGESYRHDGLDEVYTLFMAVRLGASEDIIKLLHSICPKAIKEKDKFGWTILHNAILTRSPAPILRFLIARRPDALQMSCNGCTPLHLHLFVCRSNASIEIVRMLTEEFSAPSATSIHYACACEAPQEVVRLLAPEFPASLAKRDRAGWNLLHLAQRPDELVHYLVVRYPERTNSPRESCTLQPLWRFWVGTC